MADQQSAASDPDDPFRQVFDEAFAAAATIREPSAAERARKPSRLARRRAARRARPGGRVRASRHALTTTLILLLIFGVLGGAGWALRPPRQAARTPAPPSPSPLLPADPFAGSPAETFAAGAAGIVPPRPHAAGPFPAAQVARAYRLTRRLLIAAHLDPATLAGARPDAFARLLGARERRIFLRDLGRTGLGRHGGLRSTRSWVTTFAPGTTELATAVIKVHGRMSASPVRETHQPVLRVTADYLFVYAVEPPGQPQRRTRIVDRDVVQVDFAPWANPGGPLEPWWKPQGGGPAGGSCDYSDGFIHPAFPASAPQRVRPSGKPFDPYDQSVPPPAGRGCRQVTRT